MSAEAWMFRVSHKEVHLFLLVIQERALFLTDEVSRRRKFALQILKLICSSVANQMFTF